MRPYELMFILDVSLSEDERRDIVSDVEHEVVDVGGEMVSTTQYGVRDLAYPISGAKRGDYRLIRFYGDPQSNQDLQERLNYRDDLLRYLLTLADNERDLEKFRQQSEEEESVESEEETAESEEETEEVAEETATAEESSTPEEETDAEEPVSEEAGDEVETEEQPEPVE